MASRIHREVYVRFWREYGTVEVDDRLCLPHELDSEVQKLQLLKAHYDSQRYALQDAYLEEYPARIRKETEKLSRLQEDQKTIAKETKDMFCMEVEDIAYLEHAEAAQAVEDLLLRGQMV